MGKSLKARIKQLFCCFHEKIEDEEEPQSHVVLHVAEADKDFTEDTAGGKEQTGGSEKENELTDVAEKSETPIGDGNVQGIIDQFIEKKIRFVTAGIGRKVDYNYTFSRLLQKNVILTSQGATKDVRPNRSVNIQAFRQSIRTHQRVHHDRKIVNTWSRHMSEATCGKDSDHQLFYTNVNLNKVDVPFEVKKSIVEKQPVENGAGVIKNGDEGMRDTRDINVRPRCAGRVRTRHCFTDVAFNRKKF